MMGKTHQVGGVGAAAIGTTALFVSGYPLATHHPELLPTILLGGWLGGMMPDIDHPNSKISRMKLMGLPLFKPIAWLINALFGHRGATHTVWALLLTWIPFLVLPFVLPPEWVLMQTVVTLFGLGYAIGYWSHLLLDSLTPSGTPMFWPLPDVHLAQIPTGKYDVFVRLVLIVLTGGACWALLYWSGL